MMNNGDANMEMREATLRYPTNVCLMGWSKHSRLTNAMAAKTQKTPINSADILACTTMTS